MKQIFFWLYVILELSGPLCGIVMAISFVAGLIKWAITGNEHSIFEKIMEIAYYGIEIYCVWFFISGLIAIAILSKNK